MNFYHKHVKTLSPGLAAANNARVGRYALLRLRPTA
jgi:hypothetical protein